MKCFVKSFQKKNSRSGFVRKNTQIQKQLAELELKWRRYHGLKSTIFFFFRKFQDDMIDETNWCASQELVCN